ncbi:hypothetical protein HDU85_007070 [Gaertneriomyces sp. JEL0708]|nr:hypothetical protein HDU85_007070 [Gaertneriomyces sp. JEL0708]
MAQIEANPRGIPRAPFVEKVEEFVAPGEIESTLRKFQEMAQKYRFMETHLLQRKKSLETKMPEIKKTLDMVGFLMSKKSAEEPIETQYELNDSLLAKASIAPSDKVYLWLGANVMLEYSNVEALELLTSKLASAKQSLSQVDEDLEYLREQITTMEVNTARVYNYDVKLRRVKKDSNRE